MSERLIRGDRVVMRSGAVGEVLRAFDNGAAVIDLGDGEPKRWGRGSFRPMNPERPPRGMARSTERDREIARRVAAGENREAIAKSLGIKRKSVDKILSRVREAAADAKLAAAGDKAL